MIVPIPDADGIIESILPWASRQRWFPSDWKTSNWHESSVYSLGNSAIVMARPTADGPWLQLPWVEGADGTTRIEFWRDWLRLAGSDAQITAVAALGKEQSNSSVILDTTQGTWIAKLFRVVYPGDNPDITVGLQLTRAGFAATAPVQAYLSLPLPVGPGRLTSGVVTALVENTGNAYDYFRQQAEANASVAAEAFTIGILLGQMQQALPPIGQVAGSGFLEERLRQAEAEARLATDVLPDLSALIATADRASVGVPLGQIHGDLHLEQILRGPSGKWTFIDFEGEPLRPLDQRVRPDFGLRDLAGLLRSIDYTGWQNQPWVAEAGQACKAGYAQAFGRPIDEDLLHLLVIEKALYEVKYEALFRPERLSIPLRVFA